MAIKVLILLPSSRMWPLCDADISLCPEAGARRLSSLFVQDQRSVQQQEALTGCFGRCWAPSIGPRGRWESESFPAYYFPHHSVREARLWRLWACLCGQNKRVTQGGKQQSLEWYFTLTRSLTCCQIPHLVPFWRLLLADFDWLV